MPETNHLIVVASNCIHKDQEETVENIKRNTALEDFILNHHKKGASVVMQSDLSDKASEYDMIKARRYGEWQSNFSIISFSGMACSASEQDYWDKFSMHTSVTKEDIVLITRDKDNFDTACSNDIRAVYWNDTDSIEVLLHKANTLMTAKL